MLRLRVASAAVLVPVLLGAVLLGTPWLVALVALLALVAGWETADLLHRAGLPAHRYLTPLLALVVVGAWAVPLDPAAWGLVVGAAVLVTAFEAFNERDPRTAFLRWSAGVFGIVYVGMLAFVVRLLTDAPPIPPGVPLAGVLDAGRVWLLVLVLGVWSYDTFAYLAGRVGGRGRFMTHISPSKTWSGVLGGLIACAAVTTALFAAAGQPALYGAPIGVVVAATAQAGDLAESLLKRAAGAKDSGSLIPGHGGVLDRIDSFLFAAPAFYLCLVLVPNG